MTARGGAGPSVHETVLQLVGERGCGSSVESFSGTDGGVSEWHLSGDATSRRSGRCGVYGIVDDRVGCLRTGEFDIVFDPYRPRGVSCCARHHGGERDSVVAVI